MRLQKRSSEGNKITALLELKEPENILNYEFLSNTVIFQNII